MLRHRPQAVSSVPLPCELSLFVSPRVIGFPANNRPSNLVFLTFCEDRSTQSLAKMLRHNEIQDGGADKVETASVWPFFAHETSRS